MTQLVGQFPLPLDEVLADLKPNPSLQNIVTNGTPIYISQGVFSKLDSTLTANSSTTFSPESSLTRTVNDVITFTIPMGSNSRGTQPSIPSLTPVTNAPFIYFTTRQFALSSLPYWFTPTYVCALPGIAYQTLGGVQVPAGTATTTLFLDTATTPLVPTLSLRTSIDFWNSVDTTVAAAQITVVTNGWFNTYGQTTLY